MVDVATLGARLRAVGAELPDELLPLVTPLIAPLLEALDALGALDLGDFEPFVPARQLVDDAAP